MEIERAKGGKLNANVILELEELKPKESKLFSMYLKDNMQSRAICYLYTDDCNNPNDILKSVKNLYEKLYTER